MDLSRQLAIVRRELDALDDLIKSPHPGELRPGDVVQIRPGADAVFGGLLLMVQRIGPAKIEGYLLRPHRGGCREAWTRATPPEVEYVGTPLSAVSPWGLRRECESQTCRIEHKPAAREEQPAPRRRKTAS
jgi:hypothetical protein